MTLVRVTPEEFFANLDALKTRGIEVETQPSHTPFGFSVVQVRFEWTIDATTGKGIAVKRWTSSDPVTYQFDDQYLSEARDAR